jgi:hypothetical protein
VADKPRVWAAVLVVGRAATIEALIRSWELGTATVLLPGQQALPLEDDATVEDGVE